MKKMKKILAFVMAMAMVLGMSVTALAATPGQGNEFGKEGDKGSITISGIAEEAGIEIALYPVVEAIYDPTTEVFEKYEVVKKADGTPLYTLTKDADGNYVIDQETLDAIGTVAQTSGTPLADIEWEYDIAAGGYKTKTDCVPVGMYLALITGAEAKIYNYAVASLYYTVEDGDNTIGGGTLTLENANSIVKVSEHPDVEKTAKDSDGAVVPSANIGDEISYTLKITDVPYYGGEAPVLNLVDTLSTGLTFKDNVVVKTTDAAGADKTLDENTDYTVTTYEEVAEKEEADKTEEEKALTAGQILINFVVGGEYMLNPYAGKTVTVTYSAILNENAAINEAGNTNGVVLNYTKDSKVNSGVKDTTEEKKTYTYTFDIDGAVTGSVTEGILTKTGEFNTTTNSNALDGATFTLYTQNPDEVDDAEVYKNYKFEEDGTKVELFGGTVESQNGGQLPVRGLAEGTYYLKETEAPKDYTLNTHVFVIKIEGTYENNNDSENKGKLLSWTITIDGVTANTFTVEQGNVTINKDVTVDGESVEGNVIGVDIPNTKISSLPSTGGIGTTIFTIGGCAIMILAAGLYFASRRKSAK
ncbi:MAG: isopeptide-forming domain-containing fimbrial protein [Lachnospiraceae bacterium]|nr:isopeptide-forming domain-containing fimbrial protein [Lachnospiraceae bacterium]